MSDRRVQVHLAAIIAARTDGDPEEFLQMYRSVQRRIEWRKRRGYKVCADCRERKSPLDFGMDSRNADGLHRLCRACRAV